MRTDPKRGLLTVCLGVLASLPLLAQQTSSAQLTKNTTSDPRVENYLRLPMSFERQGTGAAERFGANGPGYSVGVQGARVVIGVVAAPAVGVDTANPLAPARSRALSLEFLGAKPHTAVAGEQLPGKVNRMYGKDSRKWQIGLPTFKTISYLNVYPGIDVVYYGSQSQLEFDLVVKPGADPKAIRLKVSGASGLSVDDSGSLSISQPEGELKIALPKIYQEVAGKQKNVAGHFRLHGRDEVAFDVDVYDRTRPLVIDPTIVYSAMLGGGTNSSFSNGVAVDASGNILIAGYTFASDFPLVNPVQTSVTVTADAFISKINAAGTELVYSSYLGGSSSDYFYGIAVDSTGAAWATGFTQSIDFPVQNALQPSSRGGLDAIVAKFSPSGALLFSSYLGGSSTDLGYGIAVDSADNAYVTGYASGNFPTTAGVFQAVALGTDAFVVKFNSAGNRIYSTLLGGSSTDIANGIAVDSAGSAYVTGYSYSSSVPNAPAGGAQTTNNGGQEAFVAKLNPAGTALAYFTFFGGAGSEQGKAIAVDATGNAYFGGYTNSTGLATAGAAQTVLAGGQDGFIAKLNPTGTAFSYVTYFGGTRPDYLNGLSVDASGNVYVAGYTTSANIPVASAVQPAFPGNPTSLFQTGDSAVTWTPLDTNVPGTVYDISQDPGNPNTLVVLADTGIYRSTNYGASWTQQSAATGSGFIVRSPLAPTTLYANLGTSFYRSTDNGITWAFMGSYGPNGIFFSPTGLVADTLNTNTLYAFYLSGGTSGVLAVHKSTDGGTTWSAAASGLPAGFNTQVVSMVATPAGTLYAAFYQFGVYQSTNQGDSWVSANTGLLSSFNPQIRSLSVSGSTVYLAYGGLSKSTDGGAHFFNVPNSVSLSQIAVSPVNPSLVYGVTFSGTVQLSTDGGLTWNSFGTGLPTVTSNWPLAVSPVLGGNAFLIPNVPQSAFVAKLNATGSAFTWSSYLGGTSSQQALAVVANGSGAVVTGYTNGQGFPVTTTALPTGTSGTFVTRISDTTTACSVVLTPATRTTNQFGNTLRYSAVAPSGCTWNAVSSQPWVTITSGASGIGAGVITIQTLQNSSGATRTATLTVGSATATITQPDSSCAYSLDTGGYVLAVTGGTVTPILTTGTGCPWVITNNYGSTVTINSPSSGTGSLTLNLTVAANHTTSSRAFSLAVGSARISINQLAGTVVAPLAILNSAVASGTVGVPYSAAFAASGGTSAYSWNISSGALPPGLTLNPSTGIISGTPTSASGSPFSFTVTLTDGASSPTSKSVSIAIAPFGISSLSPSTATVAGPNTLVTISGTGLGGTSKVVWTTPGGVSTQLTPSLIAATQVSITVPSSLVTTIGTAQMAVTDGSGALSNQLPFTVVSGTAPTNTPYVIQQAEVLSTPRTAASRPLLFPFVTNQLGFDTEITLSNTSQDAVGSSPVAGTCTLNFYGAGAPFPSVQTTLVIAPGKQLVSNLSNIATGFQGYMIANCSFPLARGFAKVNNGLWAQSQEAQILTLPRFSSAPQALVFPYVTNQLGFDTGIAIANSSTDPFGPQGATASAGTCTLSLYGAGAPTPNSITTPNIPSGTVFTQVLSGIAPGFQGYMTASCNFSAAAGFGFVTNQKTGLSETAESITVPRSSVNNQLLFTGVTAKGGRDTTIAISNTTSDPFGNQGAIPAASPCTLSFYGSGVPTPNSVTTPNIPSGTVFTIPLSAVAPGFEGYVTASCNFGPARGFAFISTGAATDGDTAVAEAIVTPRTNTSSPLLFSSVTNWMGSDTAISIWNTSLDPFGTTSSSGICTLYYYGSMFGGGAVPSPQTSSVIPAGGQLSFSLSQGNATQGIAPTPGFRGYIIAGCGFPLARGAATITGISPGLSITTTSVPSGAAGTPYSVGLGPTGGAPPYGNWTITSGALPSGLSLNSASGAITGTPAAGAVSASPYSFSANVQDSAGTTSAARPYSILISLSTGTGSITGTVVWNGNLIPNSPVVLKNTGDYYTLPVLASTTTGGDGTFALSNLPAGQFALYAQAPSSEYWQFASRPVTVTSGSVTNAGVFALSKIMQLLSPANSSTISTTTPTLVWSAFPGATSYYVVVYDNAAGMAVFSQASITSTQVTISPALTPGKNYQWSVYASNANGQIAYYSAFYFSTAAIIPTPTTYTYQGKPFTSAPAPYTTSNFITGSFTTTSALAVNLAAVDITSGVATYSFTDGSVNTITQANASSRRFIVSTDAQGRITAWDVTLILGSPPTNTALFTCSGISTYLNSCPNNPFDESYQNNGQTTAYINSNPGTWSSTVYAGTFPAITGIVNNADFSAPPLAPGSLATLFGSNLASSSVNSSVLSVPFPTSLGGVSLSINGVPAPLNFVSTGQITFQIPYGTAVGSATAVVTNNLFTSNSFQFQVLPTAPGLFSNPAAQNSNGTANSSTNPVAQGGTVIQYLTGLGAVNPTVADGALANGTSLSVPLAASTATIGGLPTTIAFIGLVPGAVGFGQASIQVPPGLQNGSYPLVITVGGRSSGPSTIYLASSNVITFPQPADTALTSGPVTLTATATSNLAVTYLSNTIPVCTVSGSSVALITVGTCSVTANQAGNASFAAASAVTKTFSVLKGLQTINFSQPGDIALIAGPVTLTATATSGLAVGFASNSTSVCTVSGSSVTLVAAGLCSVTASQAGNANFNAATTVMKTFNVTGNTNVITFPQLADTARTAGPVTLTATATSALAVTYTSNSIAVCTVAGSSATLVAVGTCSITANQSGNGSFLAATPVTRTFLVTQAVQSTVTLALGDGNGFAGDAVELPIQLTSVGTPALSTFQLDMSFDPQKLTFKSARVGAQLTASGKSISVSAQPNGDIRLLAVGFNQNVIANGVVAYATFTLGSPFSASPVTPKTCTSADAQGSIIATACTAGAIRLPSCDINADGTTNVADVQLIINEALGVNPPIHDLNHDGAVNVADVQKVINAALGLGCSVQ
jgi:uncharacterized protein (TIGR03437 family)